MTLSKQHLHPFLLIEATSQEWVAGVKGGGRGIDFRFMVKIITEKEVRFDSIWIAGQKLRLNRVAGVDKVSEQEVIILHTSISMGSSKMNGTNKEGEIINVETSDTVKAPIKHKGPALLGYTVDGKYKYFDVSEIIALPISYRQ